MMCAYVARCAVWLIGFVTLIYSVPLVVAGDCALAHADHSQSHRQHHHDEQESSGKNSLCIWACQGTTDAGETKGRPPAVTEMLVGPVDFILYRFSPSANVATVPTRAPPSIPFVRHA